MSKSEASGCARIPSQWSIALSQFPLKDESINGLNSFGDFAETDCIGYGIP